MYKFILNGKETKQSGDSGQYSASYRAIDGSQSTCSKTAWRNNPWWAVDMGEMVTVYSVALTNRDWEREYIFQEIYENSVDLSSRPGQFAFNCIVVRHYNGFLSCDCRKTRLQQI